MKWHTAIQNASITCAHFNIVYDDEAHENMDIMQIISFVAPRRKIIGYVSNIMKVCK